MIRALLAAIGLSLLAQTATADLVFKDEFSAGPAVNTSKWRSHWPNDDFPRNVQGNGDRAAKVDDDEKTTTGETAGSILRSSGCCGSRTRYLREVSGGTLKLRGWKVPTQHQAAFWGFPYASGMISSEASFSQPYGTWEVRFRVRNVSQGHHFAFWLLPRNGQWPPEVDIVEFIDDGRFWFNSHGETPEVAWNNTPGDKNWHVANFKLTASEAVWKLDGAVVRRHSNASFTKGLPMYFLVTLEIDTPWPGKTDGTTIWPAEVEIDYVRVYNQ